MGASQSRHISSCNHLVINKSSGYYFERTKLQLEKSLLRSSGLHNFTDSQALIFSRAGAKTFWLHTFSGAAAKAEKH